MSEDEMDTYLAYVGWCMANNKEQTIESAQQFRAEMFGEG